MRFWLAISCNLEIITLVFTRYEVLSPRPRAQSLWFKWTSAIYYTQDYTALPPYSGLHADYGALDTVDNKSPNK